MHRILPVLSFFLPFLGAAYPVRDPDPRIDSLQAVLRKAPADDTTRIRTHLRLAQLLRLTQPNQALAEIRQALQLARTSGQSNEVAHSHNQLGLLQWQRGQMDSAQYHLKQAHTCYSQELNHEAAAGAIGNLGGVLYGMGEYEAARQCVEQAIDIYEANNLPAKRAQALSNLSSIYIQLGQLDQAIKLLEECLVIMREREDKRGIAAALNNLGLIYQKRSQFDQALARFQESLRLMHELGDSLGAAKRLGNIAGLHYSRADYDRAQQYYQHGYEVMRRAGDLNGQAASLNNMGNVHLQKKQYDQAEAFFTRSLAIRKKIEDRSGQSGTLNSLGLVYQARRRYGKALTYFERSLKLSRDLGERMEICRTLVNLGRVYQQLARFDRADSCFRQTLAQTDCLALLDTRLNAHNYLAQSLAAQDSHALAYHHVREYARLRDTLYQAEKHQALEELETRYQMEQKQKLIRRQQEALQWAQTQNTWLLTGSFLMLGGLFLLAYGYYERQRMTHLLQMQKTRLETSYADLKQAYTHIQQQKTTIVEQNVALNQAYTEIQVRNESLQQANEAVQHLSRYKDQLMGMIVHDLKNPLNTMLGLIQVRPPDIFGQIERTCHQMLTLVHNILEVQKFEEASMAVEQQVVPLRRVVEQAVGQVAYLAERKHLHLHQELPQRAQAWMDLHLIERVLVNLLTNAINHTPQQGTIVVRVRDQQPGYWTLEVEDTGKGIPADQLKEIFSLFRTAAGQPQGPIWSSGMGLTFCRMAVEAHGGRITVASEVGRGSVFRFDLRAAAPEIQTPESDLESDSAPAPGAASLLNPCDLPPTLLAQLPRLQEIPMYRVSELEEVLQEIESAFTSTDQNGLEAYELWKQQLMEAVFAFQEDRFNNLIQPETDSPNSPDQVADADRYRPDSA